MFLLLYTIKSRYKREKLKKEPFYVTAGREILIDISRPYQIMKLIVDPLDLLIVRIKICCFDKYRIKVRDLIVIVYVGCKQVDKIVT